MAISSTFYSHGSHGKVLVSPPRKSCSNFGGNNVWLKQPVHCKSICSLADIYKSVSLFSVELLKNGQSQCVMSTNTGTFQCRVLEMENKSSNMVGNKFQLDDVIESQKFDRDTLSAIFEVAREMEKIENKSIGSEILKGYLMATLFYEPSTRTRLSFESAMKRSGGEVLTMENAREFSSAAKGETLEDTIRTVEGYSDINVMRHFESGSARRAAAIASIPIINAGDGPGQHPTQITVDVDGHPRAAYFRQAKNGLYIRMALLKLLLLGR